MIHRVGFIFSAAVVACTMALNVPASAQSTNAHPVIVMGSAAVDPATLPVIDDAARKTLKDDTELHKAGKLPAFVMVGSPDGKIWQIHTATKSNFLSLEDLARQTLETCEFVSGAPCLIYSINGQDAREKAGGWPLQPAMLSNEPAKFDPQRIPFVSLIDRVTLRGYVTATSPRVMVLTSEGGWLWRQGKTAFDAIALARTDCAKTYPGQFCLLYAVDDKVVMAQ